MHCSSHLKGATEVAPPALLVTNRTRHTLPRHPRQLLPCPARHVHFSLALVTKGVNRGQIVPGRNAIHAFFFFGLDSQGACLSHPIAVDAARCSQVIALGADALDLEFCLDLMDVSDQYLVGSLKRLCEDAVLRNVTVRQMRSSYPSLLVFWSLVFKHRDQIISIACVAI